MHTKSVLQSLRQGILICDSQARILYFNESYGEFIGQKLEEVKGKPITDYRKHALAPEVIESGRLVEGVIRREGNQDYFASVYPIVEGNRISGSISIVTTLAAHQLKISRKNQTLEERVRQFEKQEIQAEISYYGQGLEGKKKAAKALGISLATLYNKLKEI